MILACSPYKRKFDHAMAAGCQVLFVLTFLGGIVVRLYEDIATDMAGSRELAYRYLGLDSSEEAVVLMILVAFGMIALLSFTMATETYLGLLHKRLESKFS
eukprot:6621776-Prymnesium_polylepis.1